MLVRVASLVGVVAALALTVVLCLPRSRDQGATQAVPDVPHHRVRVVTWNLEWFPGRTQGQTLDDHAFAHVKAVEAILREIDGDVVCVQEIKDPAALEQLAVRLGLTVQLISSFRGVQEIAIMSRMAADVVGSEAFVSTQGTPPRGMVFALYRRPSGDLLIYSLHLKSNAGGVEETIAARESSALQVVRHVAVMIDEHGLDEKTLTVVLAGDFNCDPYQDQWKGDRTLEILMEHGFVSTFNNPDAERPITWPSDGRYADATFDHILVRRRDYVLPACVIRHDGNASDHRPVVWDRE
jgi:endonuclease/exonuclease/phosphatase family metal-dependent hydrolase